MHLACKYRQLETQIENENNIFSFIFSDDERPIVDFCRSPPIFLVDNAEDIEKGKKLIA